MELPPQDETGRRVFEHYLELIGEGMWAFDANGLVEHINEKGAAILGRRPEEVLGRSITDLQFPEDRERSGPGLWDILREGAEGLDVRLRRGDGSEVWLLASTSPVHDERGQCRGLVGTFVDITARKRAEETLKNSEARYRGMFEAVQEAIFVVRPVYGGEGSIVDLVLEEANPAALKVIGLPPSRAKGVRASEVIAREDFLAYLDMFEQARQTGGPVSFERHSKAYDTDAILKLVAFGERMIAIYVNITAAKRAQRRIEEDRSRFQAFLEAAPVGVFVADGDGGIVEINDTVRQIWGNDAPLVDGVERYIEYRGWDPQTGRQLEAEDWALARALLRGERTVGEVIDIERFDGGRATILNSAAPIRDHDGRITGAVATVQDITRLKRAEDNLKRSNDELQQFAYVASHDLQEPLRMVTSYLTLLERRYESQLDDRAREYIEHAVEGSLRMRALIDDLLTYTRIDAQAKELAAVDMNEVMVKVLETLRDTREESGAEVAVRDLPTIRGNDAQMVQLMQNLLANAIKFRGRERPRIEVSASDEGRRWRFSVRDNGIGLNVKYADRIFQMFQRLHTSEEYPGTGVGLAIARKIVERHGGRIWVESSEGEGATFHFTVPKTGAPS